MQEGLVHRSGEGPGVVVDHRGRDGKAGVKHRPVEVFGLIPEADVGRFGHSGGFDDRPGLGYHRAEVLLDVVPGAHKAPISSTTLAIAATALATCNFAGGPLGVNRSVVMPVR